MLHTAIAEYLHPLQVSVKKMFGNHAIYIDDKIYLAIRENSDNPIDNGIWICTSRKHHESLKIDFPSLTKLSAINFSKWLLLPKTAEDFEQSAKQICEMIKVGDERIGVEVKRK